MWDFGFGGLGFRGLGVEDFTWVYNKASCRFDMFFSIWVVVKSGSLFGSLI